MEIVKMIYNSVFCVFMIYFIIHPKDTSKNLIRIICVIIFLASFKEILDILINLIK